MRLVGGSISLFLGIYNAGLLMLDVVPSNWFTISSTIGLLPVELLASMKADPVGAWLEPWKLDSI